MAIELNHTIIPSRDKKASAEFLADLLGLSPPKPHRRPTAEPYAD